MRCLVIEGPDGSGKSTLVNHLHRTCDIPFIQGQGREKYPGEINERIRDWLDMANDFRIPHVFDRHPAISQPIYSRFNNSTTPEPELIEEFYSQRHFIIYCRGQPTLDGHESKDYDTREHLDVIERNHLEILRAYDQWALSRATVLYDRSKNRPEDITSLLSFLM